MADLVPNNFPIPTENIIVSYSFQETLTGKSFSALYLAGVYVDGTTSYVLSGYAFAGTPIVSAGGAAAKNFDVIVSGALVADGTAILNLYTHANPGNTITIEATIKRVRGGAETTLGTATASQTGTNMKLAIPISITNQSFGKGDTLRLYINQTAGGAADTSYSFDPTSSTQNSILYMPFKVPN